MKDLDTPPVDNVKSAGRLFYHIVALIVFSLKKTSLSRIAVKVTVGEVLIQHWCWEPNCNGGSRNFFAWPIMIDIE